MKKISLIVLGLLLIAVFLIATKPWQTQQQKSLLEHIDRQKAEGLAHHAQRLEAYTTAWSDLKTHFEQRDYEGPHKLSEPMELIGTVSNSVATMLELQDAGKEKEAQEDLDRYIERSATAIFEAEQSIRLIEGQILEAITSSDLWEKHGTSLSSEEEHLIKSEIISKLSLNLEPIAEAIAYVPSDFSFLDKVLKLVDRTEDDALEAYFVTMVHRIYRGQGKPEEYNYIAQRYGAMLADINISSEEIDADLVAAVIENINAGRAYEPIFIDNIVVAARAAHDLNDTAAINTIQSYVKANAVPAIREYDRLISAGQNDLIANFGSVGARTNASFVFFEVGLCQEGYDLLQEAADLMPTQEGRRAEELRHLFEVAVWKDYGCEIAGTD